MFDCYFVGVGHCSMCWGTCCPLVNDVINTLVECGELDQDAEVSVILCFCCCICVVIEYSCCNG